MKQIRHLNKAVLSIIGALGLGGSITGLTILAHTSTNVDKLELLTRAIKDNNIEQLQSERGDILLEINNGHSAAVINGALYTWGENNFGQLGLGDTTPRNTPTQVVSIPRGQITELSLGLDHSAAIINGALYTWGRNHFGQLGLGDSINRIIPTIVTVSNETVTQIALGEGYSAAVINGALYTWGYNYTGQLGLGDTTNRNKPTHVTSTSHGTITPGTVTQISLALFHSAAIIDGALYTWGYDSWGELGLGGGITQKNIPTQVINTSIGAITTGTVTQISLGTQKSSAIINGDLYTWGDNDHGQLGLGDTTPRNIPTQVTNTSDAAIAPGTVTQIALGLDHSIAVIDGALYTWGWNQFSQLGLGDTKDRNIPTQVNNTSNGVITSGTVIKIASGHYHSAAIINGALYTWGSNYDGELGLGDSGTGTDRNIPTEVTTLEIIQKDTINLNSTNDKLNIRNKITYNVATTDIETLLNQEPYIIPSLSSSAISNIAFKSKIGKTSIGGNDVGQIIVTFTANSKKFETTFNGFRPVNQTQNIMIAKKSLPVNETSFANDEINQLVTNANADTTGRNNKLATWIINNSSLIIGNTINEYTLDFPKDTKITKVSDVRVVDGSTGTLSFKIDVDKYYKPSTPATNLIESTSTDPNMTLTNPIVLSGFKTTTESNPTVITTSNRDISSVGLKQLFGYINNTTNITGNGLVKLNEYIDLTSFPLNTDFKIVDPQSNGKTELSFEIEASKYYDTNGIFQNSPRTFARLTINDLKDVKSMLIKNTSYDKLTPNEVLKYIGYDSANPTMPLNSARLFDYVTASNPFPSSTQFRLASAPIISNDNTELTLSIEANSWFDVDGSVQTTTKIYGPFVFSELTPIVNTNIKIKDNYEKNILSGDLVRNFGWNNITGTYNNAIVDQYVNFSTGAQNASYTIENLNHNNSEVLFTIVADRSYVNGIVTIGNVKYNLAITGLQSINNSLTTAFVKNDIFGDGSIISSQIIDNIKIGTVIGYTDPLWNQLVNTNIYPPNTTFTITNITTNDKVIFKTFSISFIASNYYDNDTTMNVPAPIRNIDINNLKFSPTSFKLKNKMPNIDANEFLEYINYNESTGAFDAIKLQEFVTLTGFDLTHPGTSTKLTNPSLVDKQITFNLEVLSYVNDAGILNNISSVYTISLDLRIAVSQNLLKNPDSMIIILASSIGGSVLLFLLFIIIILIKRKNKNKKTRDIADDTFDEIEY